MHIVSNVTGRLKEGFDALHALAATFPAGTLSGAPKVRAMEIIDEVEPVKRGIYGGAVGYLGWDGNMDRSEERSVGKECVSTCRSRWWPYNEKKKKTIIHL